VVPVPSEKKAFFLLLLLHDYAQHMQPIAYITSFGSGSMQLSHGKQKGVGILASSFGVLTIGQLAAFSNKRFVSQFGGSF
jgi:hypothetical protein